MGLISTVLSKIKPNKEIKSGNAPTFENLFSPTFDINLDARLNDVYMSCANVHAAHASKFTPEVYRGDVPSSDPNKKYINRLLSLRPNPLQSAAQFWERVANLYFLENNVFIFIEWDTKNFKEPVKALWILDHQENAVEVRAGDNGEVFLHFNLNGTPHYTGMNNIVHLARNAGPNVLGEGNKAIQKVLDIIATNYDGIEQAIKSSAFIRFIVQSSTLLNEDVRKSRAREFADAYLGKGSSGVVYLDAATNVVPITPNNKYANEAEMKLFENKIFNYMNSNEKILQAKYTEDEYQAYYDTVLAPLANKIEQELTYKLFTPKELSFGNHINIKADRLEMASLKTKIALATAMLKLPTYKPNDINRLLGMPITENGEKEYATLNYVDADKQNEYQGLGGQVNEEETPDGSNTETDTGQAD